MWRGLLTVGLFCAASALAGCSSGEPRYRVSGSATIQGEPIPFGEVIFTPDASKQNSGPQGIAQIHEGKFDTNLPGGKGAAGGPTIALVNGLSAPGGRTLCEHEIKIDLPRADTTQDFDVPKKAPTRKPQKEI